MNSKCQDKNMYGGVLYNKLLDSCKYLLDKSIITENEYNNCRVISDSSTSNENVDDSELNKYTGGVKDIKQLEFETKENNFRQSFINYIEELNSLKETTFEASKLGNIVKKIESLLQEIRNYIFSVTEEYADRNSTNQYNDLISKYKIIQDQVEKNRNIDNNIIENNEKNNISDFKKTKLSRNIIITIIGILLIIIAIIILVIQIFKKTKM